MPEESNSSILKWFRSLAPELQRIIEWILIFFLSISLVLLSRDWLRFLLLPLGLVVFLRVADRIPMVGPLWRWLFGSRSLWDWLTLLFIPLALAVIGLQISEIFNAKRSDSEVEKTRFEAVERYLTSLTTSEILPLDNRTVKASMDQSHNATNSLDEATRYGCGYSQPRGVTAASLTLALSNNLSNLRTSKPDKQIQKKIVLEYLYNRSLINRGKDTDVMQKSNTNVLSLRYADMTSGNYYQARLAKSCLNSIMFADSSGSDGSSSDFRFADLKGANLSGANLARANLRKANMQNAVLNDYASLYRADLRGANLRGIVYDKFTKFDGAIFNTKTIEANHDRKGWWGTLLCGRRIRIIDTSRLCMDDKDYLDIPPTQFPDDFYQWSGVDPRTKMPVKKLLMPKIKSLIDKVPLVESNHLP